MLRERILQIRERLARATEGPWKMVGMGHVYAPKPKFPAIDAPEEEALICSTKHADGTEADAEFIAHARQDIPWLLDHVIIPDVPSLEPPIPGAMYLVVDGKRAAQFLVMRWSMKLEYRGAFRPGWQMLCVLERSDLPDIFGELSIQYYGSPMENRTTILPEVHVKTIRNLKHDSKITIKWAQWITDVE